MSKKITINAAPGSFTFENVYDPEKEAQEELALRQLQHPIADDDLFNNGKALLGDPYIDAKYDKETIGKGIVKDRNGWYAKHVVAIQIYRTNSYFYLLPGDKLVLTVATGAEAAFYLMQRNQYLKITPAVEEGDEREIDEDEFDAPNFLDRTTGIGDDAAINFDSEAVTDEMINGKSDEEEEPEGDGEGGEDEGDGEETPTPPATEPED